MNDIDPWTTSQRLDHEELEKGMGNEEQEMKPRVCFFARVADPSVLERVEFYAQDIQILRDLGCDLHIATHLYDIRPADLYFVWWWTWAFYPIAAARVLRKPVVVTGVIDLQVFAPRPKLHQRLMK